MTIDLEEIEKRANAATPGPWCSIRHSWEGCSVYGLDFHVAKLTTKEDAGEEDTAESAEPNAEFIANAREDIPALIARVRELEETDQKAKAEIQRLNLLLEQIYLETKERHTHDVLEKELHGGGIVDVHCGKENP